MSTMRTVLTTAALIAAFGAASAVAEAGSKTHVQVAYTGGGFGFGYAKTKVFHGGVKHVYHHHPVAFAPQPLPIATHCAAPVYAPAGFVKPAFFAPVHAHAYHTVAQQAWVAPAYRKVLAGYDSCGRPVFRQVCVRPGYYRTVHHQACGCGHVFGS